MSGAGLRRQGAVVTATRRPDPSAIEAGVLTQLGLDGRATSEDVAKRHDELVAFLATAPRSLWPWARAQAALVDEAYTALSDPSAKRRPEALSGRSPRTASRPGGPATPPARQAILTPLDPSSVETADGDDVEETFEELLAAVTPSTHRESVPVREQGRPEEPRRAATAAAAVVGTVKAGPAGSSAGGSGLRTLGVAVAAIAVLGGIVFAGYQLGNPGAAATPTRTPAPAASTSALDSAKVSELMGRVQKDPNDKEALLGLGDAFFKASDFKTAADWLEKLVKIDAANTKARLALGAARFNLGDADAAKAQWLEVLKLDANNVEAHYDLGFLYFNAEPQDLAGVQREWGQVMALSPDSEIAKVVKAHLDALASQPPTSAAPGASGSAAPSASSATPTGSVAP